jgi:tetratricopeptide (TPR) repeat protein
MVDPLPAVPLFRAVGVADAMFAADKAEDAESLVRALLRRPGATAQRPNLLVYLMTQQLKAGRTAQVIEVQDELSQGYGLESPNTVLEALGKCILAVRDKNPAAEIASTRLMCEIINGDSYRCLAGQGSASKDEVTFWRAVLEWSQDPAKTAGLEEFARRAPDSKEADLARVLLARCALDRGQCGPAGEWLRGIPGSSAVSALAGEQRRRLKAFEDRDRVLREQLGAIGSQYPDADIRAECEALLGQVDGARPPAPSSQGSVSQIREGPTGQAYADGMNRMGLALRAAARYQQASECFHKGFAGAPYAKSAAHLLKEEAWTLRFYLADMDESEIRLKQLVATYPHHPAAQWARTYLSTQANLEHPE